MPFDGQLITHFSVRCGMCHQATITGICSPNGDGTEKRGIAVEGLKRFHKWALTRAWGFICPQCDKHGSGGVVPEFGTCTHAFDHVNGRCSNCGKDRSGAK